MISVALGVSTPGTHDGRTRGWSWVVGCPSPLVDPEPSSPPSPCDSWSQTGPSRGTCPWGPEGGVRPSSDRTPPWVLGFTPRLLGPLPPVPRTLGVSSSGNPSLGPVGRTRLWGTVPTRQGFRHDSNPNPSWKGRKSKKLWVASGIDRDWWVQGWESHPCRNGVRNQIGVETSCRRGVECLHLRL